MPTATLDAGTVDYEITGPDDGRPVVFIHGFAMGGDLWRPVAERLATRGLRCIAPTWPIGAHRVAMRPGADVTMDGQATIVESFLDALDLRDVVLVGNDTGGVIAQIVAGRRSPRVGALVLTSCDAFEHFPPPILKPFIAAARTKATFRAAAAPMRTRFGRNRGYGKLAFQDLEPLVRGWVAPMLSDAGVREDLRRFTASLDRQQTLDAARALAAFDRPALVAWSEKCEFFYLEDGQRLAAILPQGRFELIKGARTFSMLDAPDDLAGLIGDFALQGVKVA